MINKHTPTPWDDSMIRKSLIPAMVKINGYSMRTAEANVEYIVKAVNSHEELLEACKNQRLAIDWLFTKLVELDKNFYPSKSPVWKYLEDGNKAIAKAEGK